MNNNLIKNNKLGGEINIKISVKPKRSFNKNNILDLEEKLGNLQISAQVPASTSQERRKSTNKNSVDSQLSRQHPRDRTTIRRAANLNRPNLPVPQKSKRPKLPSTSTTPTVKDSNPTGRPTRWEPKNHAIGRQDSPYCTCSKTNTKPEKKDNYVCDRCHIVHRFDCNHSIYLNYEEYAEDAYYSSEEILCNECDLKYNPGRIQWFEYLTSGNHIPPKKEYSDWSSTLTLRVPNRPRSGTKRLT